MATPTEPVEVYRAASGVEAHAVRSVLAEAGVDAVVVGDGLEAVHGAVPLGTSTAPRVLVAEQQVSEAAEVIDRWRTMQREQAESEPRRPFQFGLGYVLVNMTLFALLLGIASPFGAAGVLGVAWPMFCLLLFGNLLYLAFDRRRSRHT